MHRAPPLYTGLGKPSRTKSAFFLTLFKKLILMDFLKSAYTTVATKFNKIMSKSVAPLKCSKAIYKWMGGGLVGRAEISYSKSTCGADKQTKKCISKNGRKDP